MSDQKWFYASNGQKVGPVSWDHLMAGLKTNAFSEETLVWAENLPEWTPLGKCMEAGPQAASPAVVPPLEATPSPNQAKPFTAAPSREAAQPAAVSKPKRRSKLLVVVLAVTLLGIVTAVVVPAILGQRDRARQLQALNNGEGAAPVTQNNSEITQKLKAAGNMIDAGKLDPEGIKRIKAQLQPQLNPSDGNQLACYGAFLWAASEAVMTSDPDAMTAYQQEGLRALEQAEKLGWTRAYVVDGMWGGQIGAALNSMQMGANDPRTDLYAIFSAATKWVEGARRNDQECDYLMAHLAPSWKQAEPLMGEINQLAGVIKDKRKNGASVNSLQMDVANLDRMKTQWLNDSGMTSAHAADHSQHQLPCWQWASEKGSEWIGAWNQAHPDNS